MTGPQLAALVVVCATILGCMAIMASCEKHKCDVNKAAQCTVVV